MTMIAEVRTEASPASVNGRPLHVPGEALSVEDLRQRACTELLRQAAQAAGLLEPEDETPADGVISEAAAEAIQKLLDREIALPEPSEQDCRRYYQAHAGSYPSGERVHARHILFGITAGMDVAALRRRAEIALLDVRCHDGKSAGVFANAARELSNCPSAADGGDLGWLTVGDCAPEFSRELFGRSEVGVLPRLVHSRFGLHVVEVLEREPGRVQSFEEVRGAVANSLRQQTFVTALRQYLSLLAGLADVRGVDLDAADTPLVQ